VSGAVSAGPLRVASFNADLTRRGPGLLLGDILSGEDAQVRAVVEVIARVAPDILALQGLDYDHDGAALSALADALAAAGHPMPHRFAARPNAGWRTGLDHNGDGRSDGPRDAQGYGPFPGVGGMAVLSRFPILADRVRDFSALRWADLPGATLPMRDGKPFPSAAIRDIQRLSSVAHWDVPVRIGDTVLHVLTFHATPPVFDGPEDMNGLRNRDELRLWPLYLDGKLAVPPPDGPYVLMGDANLDPADGDGRHASMRKLLAGPFFADPRPRSAGAAAAASSAQAGDPALDTADWPEDGGPGNLRVDYVLPAPDLKVSDAGVFWPAPGQAGAGSAAAASRHHLVWVDVDLP